MRVDWATQRAFIYGSWEPEVQRAVVSLVREGYRTFDIGAHIGYYTLILSKLVGNSGSVVAFEPLSDNFQVLRENIAVNSCFQTEPVAKAVWHSSGQLELAVQADAAESFPRRASAMTKVGERRVLVDAVSLDDLWANRTESVDFIKIDVEGAEEQVLRGAREMITRSHPAFLIELHHFHCSPEDSPVPSMLASFGYRVRWLDRSHSTSHITAVWREKQE